MWCSIKFLVPLIGAGVSMTSSIFVPSFASSSAFSFPSVPTCALVQTKVSDLCFTLFRDSMVSRASRDLMSAD